MLFVTRNNCIIRRKNVVQHVRCLKSVIRTVKNVDGHSYVFFLVEFKQVFGSKES